jgi:hypothetical protein
MGRIQRFWLLALLVVLMGIAASAVFIESVTAKPTPLQLPNARIVYFVPKILAPSEDIPQGVAVFQNEGVSIVHDFESLKQLVSANPPDAIILHADSIPQVNLEWLRNQFQSGVIIAGMNIRKSELSNLVGYRNSQEPANVDEGWYKKPYYSYAGRKVNASGGAEVSGTNNINAQEGTMQQFFFALRLAVKNLKEIQ